MEKYIPRELKETIKPFLKRKEILAIVGARQVGKTTFLKDLFSDFKKQKKKVEFLTFERKNDLALFEDIEDFKNYYKDCQILIIDEFHYAKEGGQKLKYLFDTTKTKFIISGSSSLELTFETGRYLVGRMFKFLLYPFSFREFLLAKDKRLFEFLKEHFDDPFSQKLDFKKPFGKEINLRLQKFFEEYLIFGGYPAVVLAKRREEKIKILESILENYLLRDVGALLNLKTKVEILKMAEFLSTQIGNLLNYQELSRVSNLKSKEVITHLEILKNTFLVETLRPFYRNPRTELVKTPKIYFFDNGFRNYLISDFKEINKRNNLGQLVENCVFSFLQSKNLGKMNFWRTKSKAEVDFIIQREGEIVPVEVKYSLSPSIGKSLFSFLKKFSPRSCYILTQGFLDVKKIKKTKIYFVPAYYL